MVLYLCTYEVGRGWPPTYRSRNTAMRNGHFRMYNGLNIITAVTQELVNTGTSYLTDC